MWVDNRKFQYYVLTFPLSTAKLIHILAVVNINLIIFLKLSFAEKDADNKKVPRKIVPPLGRGGSVMAA